MGDKARTERNKNRIRNRFYKEQLLEGWPEVGSVSTKQKKARAAAKRAKKARRKNR